MHLEKAALQREIEQCGSELASSREELEAVRSALLSKSSEVEQAQRVAGQQREVVAQLEIRCEVRGVLTWYSYSLVLSCTGTVLMCGHVWCKC